MSRPAIFREFVPGMWHIVTECRFSMFSSDSGDWKQTGTWQPQRSGWFIKWQQIRNVFWPETIQCVIRGCPHENALLQKHTCIASFWPTVNTDPENTLFWKWVSGSKNQKMQPSCFCVDSESAYFPKRWRHRPTPRPLASDLWTPRHLITTTPTMADYMLMYVPQKILSLSFNLLAL